MEIVKDRKHQENLSGSIPDKYVLRHDHEGNDFFYEKKDHIGDIVNLLDSGFIRLVDYMGDDQRVVDSARVSYADGTKTINDNRSLIDYLLRNMHTSPFEQVVFTFHVKTPIMVARQWFRHRTHRLNEMSARYSIMREEFYVPSIDRIAEQSKDNKQASGKVFDPEKAQKVLDTIAESHKIEYSNYRDLIDSGVAREIARSILSVGIYTEFYIQIDLSNIMKFMSLRDHNHAQYEIRVYAQAIHALIKQIAPLSIEAYEEHILYGVKLSKTESELVRLALSWFLDEHGNEFIEKLGKTKRQKEFLSKFNLSEYL